MSTATKVYILGAGCSVCGGYPVASEVLKALRSFADRLSTSSQAKEIRRCVIETCDRMEALGAQTVDQLAEHLHEDRKAVREAKLAMSAHFFEIEEAAVARAYPNYVAFFNEMFRYGDSELLRDRIRATPARVITFNYDRLFEQTFRKWAGTSIPSPEVDDLILNPDSSVKRLLGMGILGTTNIEFADDGFTFLKLHGGIGQYNRSKDHGMNHIYWPRLGESIPPVNDDPYFEKPGYVNDMSTIAFPSDKKHRSLLAAANPFRTYMDRVEEKAKSLCRTAKEIHLIGYSIQPIDLFSVKAIIKEATICRRIVIRNRASQRKVLEKRLGGLQEEFNATWEIEFEEEDFFELPVA